MAAKRPVKQKTTRTQVSTNGHVDLDAIPDTTDRDRATDQRAARYIRDRIIAARVGGADGIRELADWHTELEDARKKCPPSSTLRHLLRGILTCGPEEEEERLQVLFFAMLGALQQLQQADASGELQDPTNLQAAIEKGLLPQVIIARYSGASIVLLAALAWTTPPEPPPLEGPTLDLPVSLVAPKVRSRRMLAPPIVQLMHDLCGANKEKAPLEAFIDAEDSQVGGLLYRKGKDPRGLQLLHKDPVPIELRNANVEKEALQTWASAGLRADLEKLDEAMWDVLALAMTAFYARVPNETVDTPFPLLVNDYLEWRGVDPRKRTDEMRHEIYDRLRLACSGRFRAMGQETLHVASIETGRKKAMTFTIDGPVLVWHGNLYRNGQTRLHFDGTDRPDGVHISLGHWARHFVEQKAMIGIFLKRLAAYDMRRELWERRIGTYLVFTLQNMASKSEWRTTRKSKEAKAMAKMQHPLFAETILDGARIEWKPTAETNPARVIAQFVTALERLKVDGIISEFRCLDGDHKGEDLPKRGRLEKWLRRRWEFLPGPELAQHLQAKHEKAEQARKAAAERKAAKQKEAKG